MSKKTGESLEQRYRPTTRRQRLVIIALTIGTVSFIWTMLLVRPGFHLRTHECAKGETIGCVGGKADVMLIAASAPSPASAAVPASEASSAASAAARSPADAASAASEPASAASAAASAASAASAAASTPVKAPKSAKAASR